MRRSGKVKHKPQQSLEGMQYDGSTMLPNVKQELFCSLYASTTSPRFFGNGLQSYMFAYGFEEKANDIKVLLIGADTRLGRGKNRKKITGEDVLKRKLLSIHNTCKAEASRLLTEPNILARCNYLMDQLVSDKVVDRELVFVIQQRDDLSSKVGAIIHYDKKKGRIVEKQESLVKFEPITGINFVMPAKPAKGK